jgi:hypothetical protein
LPALSLKSSKVAHGFTTYLEGGICTSLISKGLLVTTPEPLGKKSRPTTFSNKELFPED